MLQNAFFYMTGSAQADDITCINSLLGYTLGKTVNLIAAGDDIRPISFGRFSVTGENQKEFPKNVTRTTIADDIEVLSLHKHRDESDASRSGIFHCRTTSNGNNITIPIPVNSRPSGNIYIYIIFILKSEKVRKKAYIKSS